MNDDEINEIIARTEEEANIYREFDIKRERDAQEAWRAAGNRGKPPPPLIQLEELPECYRTDEPFADRNELDEFEGRGARKRTVVNYNDGLSDDQWAMVSVGNPVTTFGLADYRCRLSKKAKIYKSFQNALVRARINVPRTSSSRKSIRVTLQPLRKHHAGVARRRRARLRLWWKFRLIPHRTSGSVVKQCLSLRPLKKRSPRTVIQYAYYPPWYSFVD